MKNYILLKVSLIFCSLFIQAQQKPSIEINIGRSQHGSNDLPGFHYGVVYNQPFSKKIYWSLGLEGTLNDDSDIPLIYEDPNGNTIDGTLHFVTNGLQLIAGLKYNPFQTSNQSIGVSLHPFVRYQATSTNDVIGTLYPAATELPVPVRIIANESSARTYAFGGSVRLHYEYYFENQWFLGIMGGFQTDTNGDTIYYGNLKVGRSFL